MMGPGLLAPKLVCVSNISGFMLGDPFVMLPLGKLPLFIYGTIGLRVQYPWIYFRVSVGQDAAG